MPRKMASRRTDGETGDDGQRHQQLTEGLAAHVSEDTDLLTMEKETTLRFAKDQNRVSVCTEEAGLMRRLLCHPNFIVEDLRVNSQTTWGANVVPEDFEEGTITGLEGSIAIGFLSIGTSSRSTSQHAAVVPDRVLQNGDR